MGVGVEWVGRGKTEENEQNFRNLRLISKGFASVSLKFQPNF